MEQCVKYESNCEGGTSSTSGTAAASQDDSIKNEPGVATQATASSSGVYLNQQTMSAMQQILSPLQFLQAPSAVGGTTGASLSWMMPPPYQMMMLQGNGVPQPLFLPPTGSSGVFAMPDGQVLVAPISDGVGNGAVTADMSGQSSTQGHQFAAVAMPSNSSEVMQTVAQASHSANDGAMYAAADGSKPPKKPLTPYMIFSKSIWPQVKAQHSHLSSVCEIGAVVGGLWRDLDPGRKLHYNELYAKDKERYDEELRDYLKQTGLLASDVAKMRTKRPSHHQSRATATSRAAAPAQESASVQMTWANGTPVSQAASATALPTLYANHDGSVTINSSEPGTAYSNGTSGANRPWLWHPPAGDAANNSMVMYQIPMSSATTHANANAPSTSDEQSGYNGLPSGTLSDFSAAKSWNQFSVLPTSAAAESSPGRVEQLEAEVQRLKSALMEKTCEAQKLQQDLNAAMHVIGEQRLQRQDAPPATGEHCSSAADGKTDKNVGKTSE